MLMCGGGGGGVGGEPLLSIARATPPSCVGDRQGAPTWGREMRVLACQPFGIVAVTARRVRSGCRCSGRGVGRRSLLHRRACPAFAWLGYLLLHIFPYRPPSAPLLQLPSICTPTTSEPESRHLSSGSLFWGKPTRPHTGLKHYRLLISPQDTWST